MKINHSSSTDIIYTYERIRSLSQSTAGLSCNKSLISTLNIHRPCCAVVLRTFKVLKPLCWDSFTWGWSWGRCTIASSLHAASRGGGAPTAPPADHRHCCSGDKRCRNVASHKPRGESNYLFIFLLLLPTFFYLLLRVMVNKPI